MHAPAPVIPVSDSRLSETKSGLEPVPSMVKETPHPTLRVRSEPSRAGQPLSHNDSPQTVVSTDIETPIALADGNRPTSLHPSELIATHSAARSIRLRSR